MLNRLEQFRTFLKDKKIAVLGVGISNRPLIRYINGLGATVTAFDQLKSDDPVLSQTRRSFAEEGIEIKWVTGPDYLDHLHGFDLIFRTPKMRHDLPQLRAERERGAIITSEMEVFMELCPARLFGVTGSDGKTTTTTLVARMLEQAGYTVHLGGNIGTPLLDRIDLHLEVEALSAADLTMPPPAESSATVAARVAQARDLQSARYAGLDARTNTEIDGDELEKFAKPDEAGQQLLAQAAAAMRLSARGYTRVLRVSRTIAALAGTEQVSRIHVAEALSYRRQAPRN